MTDDQENVDSLFATLGNERDQLTSRIAQLESVIDRIHMALGKTAFGPQTPEEVAVFVEERLKADDKYAANLKKSVHNARQKADDYRKALDNAKIEIAKLKGQLEAK